MSKSYFLHGAILALLLGIVASVGMYNRPPSNFPSGEIISIEKGMGLKQISQSLEQKHVVKSAFLVRIFALWRGGEKKISWGEYYFKDPISAWEVARRLTEGRFGIPAAKVTIPEGLASYEIADILAANLPGFNRTAFLRLAAPQEGYLFPDTYFLFQKTPPAEVVATLKENFDKKVRGDEKLTHATTSLTDLVIMASILEKEAKTDIDRKMVAGILWKRISKGIPLQVDVTFAYIHGTSTPQVTYKDLAIESPYNLYKHTGLPPGPISNPGLEAMRAAAEPILTPYFYYLSDKSGTMHYAKTFEEHIANRNKYLK